MSTRRGGHEVEQHMSILGGSGHVILSGHSSSILLRRGQHFLGHCVVRTTFGVQGDGCGQHGAGPPQESPQGGGHPFPPFPQVGGGQHSEGHWGACGGQHMGKQQGQFGSRMQTEPDIPQHMVVGGTQDMPAHLLPRRTLGLPPPPQQGILMINGGPGFFSTENFGMGISAGNFGDLIWA